MSRRTHPKLLRIKNGVGRVYHLLDIMLVDVLRSFTCPTCGKWVLKGGQAIRGSFLGEIDDFHIRHKRFCCERCTPDELMSK